MDVASAFRDSFVLQNHIAWVKSVSIGEDTVGHFKPITSRRYLNNNHEAVFHFTRTGDVEVDRLAIGVPYKDKSNITRWNHGTERRRAGKPGLLPYKPRKPAAHTIDPPREIGRERGWGK